jgi:hypothetical protein
MTEGNLFAISCYNCLNYSEVVGDGGCRVFSKVSFVESGMRVAETATTMIARCLRSPVSAFQMREMMKGTVVAHGPHTYNEWMQ